jgi:PAS domain S-box-containing protein
MPSLLEGAASPRGLETAVRIQRLFSPEADLESSAAALIRTLTELGLVRLGAFLHLSGEEAAVVSGPDAELLLPRHRRIFDLLKGAGQTLWEVPAAENPAWPEDSLALRLGLGPARPAFLLLIPAPAGLVLSRADWEEIRSAAAWVLGRAAEVSALKRGEGQLRVLFDQSQDLAFAADLGGMLVRINPAGARLLGYEKAAELEGTADLHDLLLDRHDHDRLRELLEARGRALDFPTTFVRHDGRPLPVLLSALASGLEDGRAGYRALGRDVTLLEKVQKDLQLARQTIEGVIEGTPLAIFVLNRNHRVAYWNRACEVLTGVSKDRILGTRDHALALYRERRETMADLLLRGDLDRLHALYRDKKLVRSPLVEGGYAAEDFFPYLAGRGKNLYFSAAPVRDESGRVRVVVEVLLDLTERSRLEQDLIASEAKYRNMVEQAMDGIVIHDEQFILFSNRSFREMFGVEEVQPDERPLHRFLAPETKRELFKAQKTIQRGGPGPIYYGGRGIRADGDVFDLELSTFATQYQQRPALQTVLRDITERKQMEERFLRSERMAATGQLAFNIAHEINNPMAGIVNYVHLLLEGLEETGGPETAGSADQKELLTKILALSNRCQTIIAGLLDFAREDQHGMRPVNVNEVVRETLSLLEGQAIVGGLMLRPDLAPDLPRIMADRARLEQVLMNLIINAAEALEGAGRLGVTTRRSADGGFVEISIADTGKGISPEDRRRLFEPFFSTKSRGRGTGLGLAISHGIIKQHRGSILVESSPGQGSTFTVRLPAEE